MKGRYLAIQKSVDYDRKDILLLSSIWTYTIFWDKFHWLENVKDQNFLMFNDAMGKFDVLGFRLFCFKNRI